MQIIYKSNKFLKIYYQTIYVAQIVLIVSAINTAPKDADIPMAIR